MEKTSVNFTANVMAKVLAANRAVVYKPLISKPVWFVIIAAILALAGFIFINAEQGGKTWFTSRDYNIIDYSFLNSLTSQKISMISFYSIILATVMLLIQFTFLQNHFSKRIKIQ